MSDYNAIGAAVFIFGACFFEAAGMLAEAHAAWAFAIWCCVDSLVGAIKSITSSEVPR